MDATALEPILRRHLGHLLVDPARSAREWAGLIGERSEADAVTRAVHLLASPMEAARHAVDGVPPDRERLRRVLLLVAAMRSARRRRRL